MIYDIGIYISIETQKLIQKWPWNKLNGDSIQLLFSEYSRCNITFLRLATTITSSFCSRTTLLTPFGTISRTPRKKSVFRFQFELLVATGTDLYKYQTPRIVFLWWIFQLNFLFKMRMGIFFFGKNVIGIWNSTKVPKNSLHV